MAVALAGVLCGCTALLGKEYARCEGGWYAPPDRDVAIGFGWVYDGSGTGVDAETREYLASALRDALEHRGLLHTGDAKPELTLFCHIRYMGLGGRARAGPLRDTASLGVICGVADPAGELVALVDAGRGVRGPGYYTEAWRRVCRAVAADVAGCLKRGGTIEPE